MRSLYLETAFDIGAKLARDAVWDGARCNWFGPLHEDFTGTQELGCGTLGPTLYDGTAGIGLFLARLHKATGDPLAARTAAGAIAHALDRAADIPDALHRGVYTGFLGIGYAAIEAGAALERDDLHAQGLAMVHRAVALSPDGRLAIDVMSGNAGIIPVLLALGAAHDDAELTDAAIVAGERLLDAAEPSERGLSWNAMGEMAELVDLSGLSDDLVADFRTQRRPNLTGLSHGAGGVGWALLELAAATGDDRFAAAGRAAFAYEDSWFDAAADQWPDLRSHDPGTPLGAAPAAWCHGAVGIGLARIRAFALTGDAGMRTAIESALRISARSVIGQLARRSGNYSLCHGAAGDAEIFLAWAQASGDAQARALVDEIARHGIERYAGAGRPWPSGTPGAGESPSLMLGLAGTGHFYLRAHDPDAIPSALLIAPPSTVSHARRVSDPVPRLAA
ncbi:lanthionine synthetase LanC family protein [Sphingomonas faeni]|uniref:lanthionine synthetase LanC family protein n=1 Tax=Sphingomonas faeni TaxID=185950 RepID=UPI0033525958